MLKPGLAKASATEAAAGTAKATAVETMSFKCNHAILWLWLDWPLHGTVLVGTFRGAELAENLVPLHGSVANVPGTEKGLCVVVLLGEDVLHAVGFRASDAHSKPLEGLRVEGVVLGILLGGRRRCLVQEVAVGPQRVGEAQGRCLANLQRELPVALAFLKGAAVRA